MSLCDFIKERDEALFSLDEQKIRAYMTKYGVEIPKNKTVFWAGIHKAICNLNSAPDELKATSKTWLLEHGFKPEVW